jgi:hypothetical protein
MDQHLGIPQDTLDLPVPKPSPLDSLHLARIVQTTEKA